MTLECAGNGRARLSPRPQSQPWLVGGVGTAEWTGTPPAPILRQADLLEGSAEVAFTGLDRGIQGGVEQHYEPSLPIDDALGDEVTLEYEVNRRPLPLQHGSPLQLVVPGWYGMTHVEWLRSITLAGRRFEGYQQAVAYHFRSQEEDPGTPVTRIRPRALMAPGVPDFNSRTRHLALRRARSRAGPGRVGPRSRGWR